jgi:hypothetical protein
MAPVDGLMFRPTADEYVPPDAPILVTACDVALLVQNGEPV